MSKPSVKALKKTKPSAKPKRTYILAMQAKVVLYPTIYLEVIASSASEALKQGRKEAKNKGENSFTKRNLEQFIEECHCELPETIREIHASKLEVIPCGKANQYHSESECELCKLANK